MNESSLSFCFFFFCSLDVDESDALLTFSITSIFDTVTDLLSGVPLIEKFGSTLSGAVKTEADPA